MKKAISLLLVAVFAVTLLCACEKTPDVVAEESKVTLETLDWKFAVEGGSVDTYTLADAQKHDLAKLTTSDMFDHSDGNAVYASVTFVAYGVTLTDFLADIGKSDATEITYSGTNSHEEPISYTVSIADIGDTDKVLVAWIMNKDKLLTQSLNYVGLFFDNRSVLKPVLSLDKIIVK